MAKQGRVGEPKAYRDDVDRFWQFIAVVGDCWIWTKRAANGYGQVFMGGKYVGAHRYAYELRKGPIPEGFTIDHLCRNKLCVNPEHLEAVTQRENTLRGTSLPAVTHRTGVCQRGHVIAGENLYVSRAGRRHCRACRLERARKYNPIYNARRREAVAS